MLLLCENDDYWRGRRDCEQVLVQYDYIWSRWSPWHDVHIDTWLIPCGEWHVRVHRIDSARALKTLEGGFAVINHAGVFVPGDGRDSLLHACNGTSLIHESSPLYHREPGHIVTPPNSSIVFAECAAIPTLSGSISLGISWLCCAVAATHDIAREYSDKPQVSIERNTLCIRHANKEKISVLLTNIRPCSK